MIDLAVYDPAPIANEYLTKMYFAPMIEYAHNNRIELRVTDDLGLRDKGVILASDHLTDKRIDELKNNGCKIFAFNCVDSSYVCGPIRYAANLPLVDRIFMLSGIQRTQTSQDIVIDSEFSVTTVHKPFIDEDSWARFTSLKVGGKLHSLPYVPWCRYPEIPVVGFESRRPTIMFRGGNHFLRVLAYLFALQRGIADPDCGFQPSPYFADSMNPAFRFCDECRAAWRRNGSRYPYTKNHDRGQCNSPAQWGGTPLNLSNPGSWNNRCPKSFYWLADQFEKRHGPINKQWLESSMNSASVSIHKQLALVSQSRFYADFKWIFSIYAAQRFWEAAAVGTVNLLPERTNDQDYFPAMQPGEHYLTFGEDFTDLSADIDKGMFGHIVGNARGLYETWIRPSNYSISTNLLRHIFEVIEGAP